MKVSIYDRKTKRGTTEFFLAAFVDEKVIALKRVDYNFMPDLKTEDVAEELQRFVNVFKEEISEGLIFGRADDQTSAESESRTHLKK